MSRNAQTILQANNGAATGLQTTVVDLEYGGWNGYSYDISTYLSTQAWRKMPVIPLVLEFPKGFDYYSNPEKWRGQLRTLMELRMKSIQGLNSTLEVETTETPIGGGGEVQEDPMDVKGTRSQITYQWDEVYGMAIANFMTLWIRNLIADKDSKVANIFTQIGNKPTDHLADIYSMSMIFIQPDPTMTGVTNAWLCTNMYPKSSGEITGGRDLTQAAEQVTHDIQFTSITQTGGAVKVLAKRLLNAMNTSGANPMNRQAFLQDISPDVAALTQGFKANIENLASTSVRV